MAEPELQEPGCDRRFEVRLVIGCLGDEDARPMSPLVPVSGQAAAQSRGDRGSESGQETPSLHEEILFGVDGDDSLRSNLVTVLCVGLISKIEPRLARGQQQESKADRLIRARTVFAIRFAQARSRHREDTHPRRARRARPIPARCPIERL